MSLPKPILAQFPTCAAMSLGSVGQGPSNLAVIRQGKSKPCWVASAINVSQLRREVFQTPNSDVISNNLIYVQGPRGPSMAPVSPPLSWLLPDFSPLNYKWPKNILKSLIVVEGGGYQIFMWAREAQTIPEMLPWVSTRLWMEPKPTARFLPSELPMPALPMALLEQRW